MIEDKQLAIGKVLFLGNNDESTDQQVSSLAAHARTVNRGLITDPMFVPVDNGYYHTSAADIPWGGLIDLANNFDTIIMLDQPQSQWSHWKLFQATFKLMEKIESLGKHTIFRENKNTKNIQYWSNLVFKENKSFCIYPWINYYQTNSDLKLCGRSDITVTTVDKLDSWTNDPGYYKIRQKMLQGEKLPEYCQVCYSKYEDQGIESYRQFETLDWVTALELSNVNDLEQIQRPYFYEVHAGNHCNIKCRGCQPAHSAPIGKEFKKFKIVTPGNFNWNTIQGNFDKINIDQLDSKSSVYFQGGEPTIMPEVLKFLKQCISKNKTDFFLTMCTNGVKMSDEFLEVVSKFSNTNFSFSIDGYKEVNDYWRSGSRWDKVIANLHLLKSRGHAISINTVPGIYNVTNLHRLFEFLDQELPFTAVYMQMNYLPWQSALNHPDKDLVIESMLKCMQTSVYHSNGKSCKSSIDSIYNHYVNDPVCNLKDLKDFFDFNDQLDRARGTKLVDYIPELESARSYLK